MKTESWTVVVTITTKRDCEFLKSKFSPKSLLFLQWIQERLDRDDIVVKINQMSKRWV